MPITTNDYRSFLLRLWREGKEDGWRAMLKNISTGEQRGFADLQALVAFLQDQMADKKAARKREGEKGK
ncbi:MAG: hypothetical protein HY327_04180 [Chloroflexi bacterium]|nr:hypothetical protein [Chloroflexota bacterium]